MSSIAPRLVRAAAVAAVLALSSPAFAQYDVDPEIRIQQLEDQLRTLTGQNEELQHRNRMLEQQLQQLQPAGAPPAVAAAPPAQSAPTYRQPAYDPGGGQAPVVQEQPVSVPAQGRRGDAFDPSRNPNAPGAPRALGGGRMPMPEQAVGSPGSREAGAPLDLANTSPRRPGGYPAPDATPPHTGGLTTLPPSATPRDEFDLGIGYMQRKDYALAEETMRNFTQKYPSDTLTGDAQYWLGESLFQRQKYREAAEAFLGVTTKYDTSAKAADALLRLGQSLAALKEKEAACAALGEVTRKYPRSSAGVKQAVDREQKRVKC
ncbi:MULTISPECIES: tol-pal system protein YbgF [unclassified Nitrobacter]|uniref:tol-pal system protein YbgF n=1 Tax=unclassified Nitrobacter TaxID=2620411 RepID=UPI000928CE07|nr:MULTISPECIES: tol-pal system protein YbgF [unclassified Nitrobacter]MBN9148175.1 tol-pal system protein YbgF [Nitrobacter sp.]OJV00461.1 MAG: tol-pal system protein YbgF [Nitrobacter sp. 62-23]